MLLSFCYSEFAEFPSSPPVMLPVSLPVTSAPVSNFPCQRVDLSSDESMKVVPEGLFRAICGSVSSAPVSSASCHDVELPINESMKVIPEEVFSAICEACASLSMPIHAVRGECASDLEAELLFLINAEEEYWTYV